MAFIPKLLDGGTQRNASPLSDLATRAAAGDLKAASVLLHELAPRIARLVHSLLGADHPEVDDTIQHSLIAIAQAIPAFRGECSPWHYTSRIVTRVAVAASRRARAQGERRALGAAPEAVADRGASALDEVIAERRRTVVRELLAKLPDEQAEALALRVVLGFTLGEVAATTHTPLNTVRSRIRLAKEALRQRIEAAPELREMLELEK